MNNLKKLLESLDGKTFEELKSNCEFTIKEKDNLYMLSFKEDSDLNDDTVREANGIILEKDTNKLVHYSFPKAYDGIKKEDGEDPFLDLVGDFRSEIMIEGTLIKAFNYNDEWHVATSRNIDAVFSHWGSEKSFKELFYEVCHEVNINIEELDKDYCYSYILQHPEVLIGHDATYAAVFLINKVNLSTLEVYDFTPTYSTSSASNHPHAKVLSLADLLDELCYETNFMIITESNKRIKLLSEEYKYAKSLLNNNPCLKLTYLEAIQNSTDDKLRKYFNSKMELFSYVEDKIYYCVEDIHSLYMKKFIKREEFEMVPRYDRTVYQLHGRYKRTGEKTTCDVIYNHLLQMKTKTLYKVLNL